MTNILLLSVGTRNKVIQYFKKEFAGVGNVVVTDLTEIAPAIYEADKHYQVPRIIEDGYIDLILNICKKEQISGVLSLIDPELSLIAKNKERFAEIGVTIIGSSYDLCEMALDKMQMFTWLKEHGYNCAKSYVDKEAFYKVKDKETMDLLWAHDDNLMIQEFLNGQEIGGDCYIDMISSELVSVFTKKKILMRAGETDKAVSFKDEKLFALIEKFVKECGWSGQIDIDIFDIDGEYYISEVNPRFGGGYPHAYECGCNHMKLIKNNLIGVANEKNIGAYEEGIYMMKYNEVMIRRKES